MVSNRDVEAILEDRRLSIAQRIAALLELRDRALKRQQRLAPEATPDPSDELRNIDWALNELGEQTEMYRDRPPADL